MWPGRLAPGMTPATAGWASGNCSATAFTSTLKRSQMRRTRDASEHLRWRGLILKCWPPASTPEL